MYAIRSYYDGITTPTHLKVGIDPHNENIEEFWSVMPNYQSGFEAFIPIQNGCDKFCTYCAVPYTRGVITSYSIHYTKLYEYHSVSKSIFNYHQKKR